MKRLFLVAFLGLWLAAAPAYAQTNACQTPDGSINTAIASGSTETIIAPDTSGNYFCYSVYNGAGSTLCAEAQTPAMWGNFYATAQANVTKTACATTNGKCQAGPNAIGCSAGYFIRGSLNGCPGTKHCGTSTTYTCEGYNGGTNASCTEVDTDCVPATQACN